MLALAAAAACVSAKPAIYQQRDGIANPLYLLDLGQYTSPHCVDIDGDGAVDCVVGRGGRYEGRLAFVRNTGDSSAAAFSYSGSAEQQDPFSAGPPGGVPAGASAVGTSGAAGSVNRAVPPGSYPSPHCADFDGDGVMDCVVGLGDGTFLYAAGTSKSPPAFELRTRRGGSAGGGGKEEEGLDPFHTLTCGQRASPSCGDFDGDGDLDCAVGGADGLIHFLLNTGNPSTVHCSFVA
jgi:hypothetical protein